MVDGHVILESNRLVTVERGIEAVEKGTEATEREISDTFFGIGPDAEGDLKSGSQNKFLALQEPTQYLVEEGIGASCIVELEGIDQSEKVLGVGVLNGAEKDVSRGCGLNVHEGGRVSSVGLGKDEVLNGQNLLLSARLGDYVALEGQVGVTEKVLNEGELETQCEGEVGDGDNCGSSVHVGDDVGTKGEAPRMSVGYPENSNVADPIAGQGGEVGSYEEKLPKDKRINEDKPMMRRRGAANADLGRQLRFLISKYHIKLLVLVETKTSGEKCLKLRRKIGFDSSFVEEAQGFSGGIWILWKSDDVKVDVRQGLSNWILL
ncbi:hypothetical protein K1719_039189 [Acacia pycnantha]|nr:hypothetical protein K1719_039189 [Acacia pycnantha]